MNPISKEVTVRDGEVTYRALKVVCPGCKTLGHSGLHLLPISDTQGKRPQWGWNGDEEKPTLTGSIMTNRDMEGQCHSYLENGVWRFLDDCKHSLVGQRVPSPPLEDWML